MLPRQDRMSRRLRLVLLVDDDEDILQAAAELLRQWSFIVHTATSVAQARAVLRSAPIAVLVTDYDLGTDGTGEQLLEHTASCWPNVGRILFSGATVPAHARARAHALVEKPDLVALRRAIEALRG